MESEPEQQPDIVEQVDRICEAFDVAYFGLMNKIIADMHKHDDDIIKP